MRALHLFLLFALFLCPLPACEDDLSRSPDPCQDVLCGQGACVGVDGAAACLCDSGWHAEGLTCVPDDLDPCAGQDCSGHGACVVDDGLPACDCDPGYLAEDLTCIRVDVYCGNGVVEEGEQCDPPDEVTCDEYCQLIELPPAPVGDPCAAAADCLGDYCIGDGDGWPDGYCTQVDCDASEAAWETSCAPYGGDALCLDMDGYSLCFDRCDPAGQDCRAGYECIALGGGYGVCTPAPVCGNGYVENGEECDPPDGGLCGDDCQGTGTAPVGDPCADASECAGDLCITDAQGWPDGTCSQYACDYSEAAWETSCAPYGGDGLCLNFGDDTDPYPLCLDRCDPAASDCRTGYECYNLGDGYGICYPEPVCGNGFVERGEECDPPDGAVCGDDCQGTGAAPIGDPCVSAVDCAGNLCLTEADDGWPDGACSHYECDYSEGAWETSCAPYGGDALCLDFGGYGLCLDRCDPAASDCRTGYECYDLGGGYGICTPEPVCGNGFVEDGEECDPPDGGVTCTDACQGTGTAQIGELCVNALECAGNLCLTEADDGWPDGACSHYGCDYSEGAWETSCAPYGGDALCLDFGGYGMCMDRCDPAASDCRTGYECYDLGGGYGICTPEPVCGNGFVEDGEECDPPDGGVTCTDACQGTGTAPVGDPCASAMDCAGNWCLTAEDGYVDGYCVFAGCDLTTPGSCAPWGADAVCVNFGTAQDPYGVCMDGCSPGPNSCRAGYSCRQLSPGVRVCQP